MGNDGMSHDMSIAAEVAISYTIVPAPEPATAASLTAAVALAWLGARRRQDSARCDRSTSAATP